MENYIVINGKKAELTKEQLKALGIETEKKSPFSRVEIGKKYHFITSDGDINNVCDYKDLFDNGNYNASNYCTDKELLQQQAYREILNRLLWRYSMEHDGDKIDWDNEHQIKYCIYYDHEKKIFYATDYYYVQYLGVVYFHTRIIAQNAIKEIIEPFMKEHPDFKW